MSHSPDLSGDETSDSSADDIIRKQSSSKGTCGARCREWFRIDFSARTPIESRLKHFSSQLGNDMEGASSGSPANTLALGFGNAVTEKEVQHIYAGTDMQDKWKDIYLVLKLALALLNYGQTTVDAKLNLLKICETRGLHDAELQLSPISITASFAGRVHVLQVTADIIADKLLDATALSNLMATQACAQVDAGTATMVLNDIIERPLPYGEGIALINLQLLLSWAAIAAFMGDFEDMAATAVIAPFVIVVMQLCKRFHLGNIELCLASLACGIVTPVVWVYIFPVPVCHVPRLWAAALLVFLPGTELINGAYEIKYGAIVSGASQLVTALVRCAFMGVGLTVGWQFFGRNAAVKAAGGDYGVKASLVPAQMCGGFGIPWYMIFCVYNFPMLFHCFASLNIRIRDMLKAFVVVYPSLIAYISIVVLGELPSFVADAIGIFIATHLASFMEYKTGTPVNLSVVPMVIILAPGAPSVMSVLSSMQQDARVSAVDVTGFWSNLALQGVAYAFGLCLALEMWRPLVHSKNQVRARERLGIHGWLS